MASGQRIWYYSAADGKLVSSSSPCAVSCLVRLPARAGWEEKMAHERISRRVDLVPPSGIRRFFDIAATMPDVISLGIGEPDFVTPDVIRAAGIRSLEAGHTAYTSNSGLHELRVALSEHLDQLYGVRY